MSRRRKWLLFAVAGLWLCAVGVGMKLLWGYAQRPGKSAAAPATWPDGSRLARTPERPTLVMLAHPHCPCTRASMAELARLMTALEHSQRVNAYVLFLQPPGTAESFTQTDLWRSAAAIPGVTPLVNASGREAAMFGAETSGQTVLYDARGRLRFSGGITPARGHQGDSLGKAAILSIVNETGVKQAVSDVYGCGLRDSHPQGGVNEY